MQVGLGRYNSRITESCIDFSLQRGEDFIAEPRQGLGSAEMQDVSPSGATLPASDVRPY